MASARKVTEKRHNPVESICRKIRAIQEGEAVSNPIRQIIRYQSSSFDSPRTNSKKDLEEVLKQMAAARSPAPGTRSSGSEKEGTVSSSPQLGSPRTPPASRVSSPEHPTYSVILTSSADTSRPRAWCSRDFTSLTPQIRKGESSSNKDLKSFCRGHDFSAPTSDFDSTSDQSSEFFIPQDSEVKKFSLNEEGWELGTGDDKVDIMHGIDRNHEEELLTSIFHACDTKQRGSVGVAKIIEFLRQTTSQDSEDSGLEELWNMLDPEKRDPQVDLEAFRAVMKEWMAYCRSKWEGASSGLSCSTDESLFEQQDGIRPGGVMKTTTITGSTLGSFEALGGEVSKGTLEMSDLITYVADLHFNKQKLEEENSKFKLALEALEEANSQLSEDCTELRAQIKSAHQAIMRTNLLKEELEELKISVSAAEEQKAEAVAQKKQLEKENRALILKIRILQEENTKNIMDIDRLEKKIQEFSKTETVHQMQLHTYENTLLNKDASLQKKDLSIEELKSTITEYGSIIENLREDKSKLADQLQHLQQELIVRGIQVNVGGERHSTGPAGGKSLLCELALAASAENSEAGRQCSLISLTSPHTMTDQGMWVVLREAEQRRVELTATVQKLHEKLPEAAALPASLLRWVTDPELTLDEKRESKRREFKHVLEEKLNLCVLILNSLGNHKEYLEKEFVQLIEILKRFRLEYFCFRKEFLSRQRHLEATDNQEATLGQTLREASRGPGRAGEQQPKKKKPPKEELRSQCSDWQRRRKFWGSCNRGGVNSLLRQEATAQEGRPGGAGLRRLETSAGGRARDCRSAGRGWRCPGERSTFAVSGTQAGEPSRAGSPGHAAGSQRGLSPHPRQVEAARATSGGAEPPRGPLGPRDPQLSNAALLDAGQTPAPKARKLKTTTESLGKELNEGRPHGLLFQSCLDEAFPQSDKSQQLLQEQLKQSGCKLSSGQEARIHQPLLTLPHPCWRPDALHLDSLTGIPGLGLTPFSCVASRVQASSERPKYGEIKDRTLNVAREHECPGPRGGPHPRAGLSDRVRMSHDPGVEENGVGRVSSETLPQSREYSPLPPPGHISSMDSSITSSDSGSENLNMASGDLDSKALCEKEKTRSASAVTGIKGTSPAHENIPLQGSMSEDKTVLKMEAKEEPETIGEHRKECAAGDSAATPLPVTTVKSVNFRQSDNISASEKEVEAEFLRLSLGFKCDWFTLEKRVKLEERSRDLAEENLKKEITDCLKLLECLTPLCEDDNQAQEIIKKLEKSIMFLNQCTARVASRAEMLGAINQESRVSKAVEVMIQHVENLKRMYAKEHAELEELKQVLLQNERSFNPLEDEDDCQIKKRSSSLNSKPPSLRRVTIATLPRNIGNAGMMAGMENNDRFSRRSSSWRILGSKQSEHRPSLHRFISTYSWADAEEEKGEPKTKDDSEPPGEETVERTRKPSLSEKRNNPSKWDVSSVYDTVSSWATSLKTSIRKANKPLWISVAFIVLFAALMSFLTGRFFQKPVDAAPTQDGDSWMSLEHALWPFTRLQHNGPPPV
ncbi:inositol 1,4,5-triphosphate receptor associated 2 [Dasypus novemcinctus]|uniref:inositol 1,4,5-triphosphate receptor associated 2 n=1 Tax=Dasypus novemcinctus TaxID=9361 RepID=UPI0026602026|nr:inositol 1,4,5-triphosphate receptor associated 2 [Dasypus novemcinctus]